MDRFKKTAACILAACISASLVSCGSLEKTVGFAEELLGAEDPLDRIREIAGSLGSGKTDKTEKAGKADKTEKAEDAGRAEKEKKEEKETGDAGKGPGSLKEAEGSAPGTAPEPADWRALYREIVESREAEYGPAGTAPDPELEGLTSLTGAAVVRLLDMDNDGTDELILGSLMDGDYVNVRAEVYTVRDGKAVQLYDGPPVTAEESPMFIQLCAVDGEWLFMQGHLADLTFDDILFYGIRDGSFSPVHTASCDFSEDPEKEFVYYLDGKEIPEETYNQMAYGYHAEIRFGYMPQFEAEQNVTDTMEVRKELGMTASPAPDLAQDCAPAFAAVLKETAAEYSGMETRFALVNIDDDGVPELAVMPGSAHVARPELYMFKDGEAVLIGEFGEFGEFAYAPGKNLIDSSYFSNGWAEGTDFCCLDENGRAQVTHKYISYLDNPNNEKSGKYYIDEKEVTEDQYRSSLESLRAEYGGFTAAGFYNSFVISDENIGKLGEDMKQFLLDGI